MSYEPVLAAASGTVTRVGWANFSNRNDTYGLVIEIQHNNNSNYVTRYGHLSAVAVTLNQTVQTGQIIGTSGATGNITGAHLHFALFTQNFRVVDP